MSPPATVATVATTVPDGLPPLSVWISTTTLSAGAPIFDSPALTEVTTGATATNGWPQLEKKLSPNALVPLEPVG